MTNTRARAIAGGLVITALLVGPSNVSAQGACVRDAQVSNPEAALLQIRALIGPPSDCLGSTTCNSEICQKVNPALKEDAPTPDAVAALLREIFKSAEAGRHSMAGRRLWTRMSLTVEQYATDRTSAAAAWTREGLTIFKDDDEHEIDINELVKPCNSAAACTEAAAQAQNIIELARLFHRVLIKANQSERNNFAKHLEQLDTQWRAYLASSRGQYPWELAANSASYRKTAQFDAPPTSQWILGHPGAAFELTGNSGDRQPSESLLLELFGKYRWEWDKNKMVQRLSGSLTLAWRDTGEGEQKLGYGVLVYLPRQSTLGYVWRPQKNRADEHALVLSADLVKFIRGTQGIKERLLGTH